MSIPPLDLFVTFERVAETGSVSVAGKTLGLSKATISKQITALEAAMGVSLISRTTRRLALTEAGEHLLVRARKIVEEAECAMEEAGEARLAPRGRLKVAAPLSLGLAYLAPILPDFMRAYPEIQLDLTIEDKTIDLIGGGYDAALRISAMPDSSLMARQLAPVKLLLVGAPTYWKAMGKPTTPADLIRYACFHYVNAPTGTLWKFHGPDNTQMGVKVDGPLCANTGDMALPALYAGLGCALLPDFIVWQALADGRLENPLPDWHGGVLTLHLLTPPGHSVARKLRVFSDFLVEHFGGGRAPWIAKPR